MADLRLRINELPEELTPAPIDNIAIDGPSTRRTTLQLAADAVRPYSTEAMAREGLNNATTMTPLRVSQAIETLGGQRFASAQQGNKADTAVQPTLTISAGAGLTGGGTLAANREIALNSASIASLALANSAVQPARQVIAGVGLTGGGSLAADRTISLDAATQASLGRADSAVQPSRVVSAGAGLTGGGNLSADRTLALSAASIASLAKADSAVQPSRAVNAGAGLSGGGDLSADRTLSLSAATQASLAKADTALQGPGGTAGQVYIKQSDAQGDAAWQDFAGATAVSYGPQTLSPAQQGQARANIGAGILAGFRNQLINGDFVVWQRGVSFTIPAGGRAYTADRWEIFNDTNQPVSVARSGPYFDEGGTGYFLRLSFVTAPTTGNVYALQSIEGVDTLAGKIATFTALLGSPSGTPVEFTTYTEQRFGAGGSATVPTVFSSAKTVSGAFQKVTAAADLPGVSGKTIGGGNNLRAAIQFAPRHAAIAYDIAHVSLVKGDATAEDDPFSPRHHQQELALCQRYFQLVDVQFTTYASGAGFEYQNQMLLPVTMRAGPTQAVVVPGTFEGNVASVSLSGTSRRALIISTANAAGKLGVYNRVHSLDAEL
jgi:hypothetical protein